MCILYVSILCLELAARVLCAINCAYFIILKSRLLPALDYIDCSLHRNKTATNLQNSYSLTFICPDLRKLRLYWDRRVVHCAGRRWLPQPTVERNIAGARV